MSGGVPPADGEGINYRKPRRPAGLAPGSGAPDPRAAPGPAAGSGGGPAPASVPVGGPEAGAAPVPPPRPAVDGLALRKTGSAGNGGGGGEGAGRSGGGGGGGGRRLVPGLVSRYPLGLQLPGVYADDDFVQRFTAGLDEVIAPVPGTLDNLPAYLDPALAPADFTALLAAWVGADGGRREEVAGAVRGHAVRGTRDGLAEEILLAFGVRPEIEESGGAVGSTTPGTPLPGSARPHLTVRLRVRDPAAVDTRALTALIARTRPAHLPFTVEVLPG